MNIKDKKDLCNYIDEKLKNLGKSNVEVANILGVEPSIITNWRNGQADNPKIPGLEKACLLAQLFGVSLDDFYKCEPDINQKAPSDYKYIDYLNNKANGGKVDLELLNIDALRSLISDFINNLSMYLKEEDKLFEIEDVFEKRYYKLEDLFSSYIKALPEKYRNIYFTRYRYSKKIFVFSEHYLNVDILYEFVKNKAVIVDEDPLSTRGKRITKDYETTIKCYSQICQLVKMGSKTMRIVSNLKIERGYKYNQE